MHDDALSELLINNRISIQTERSLANMASVPQQNPGSHRQHSTEGSSLDVQEAPPAQHHRRTSIPQSLDSEDSQTVLLDHPKPSSASPEFDQTPDTPLKRPKLQRSATTKEPKKCWICFSDETEDTPTTSRWRSPCPCALKAHEACLLDWIADLETPGKKPKPIECPQCKSKIVCTRPRNTITDVVMFTQLCADQMTVPFLVIGVGGTVITGLWLHGLSTVFLVFGTEEANRLLDLDIAGTGMNDWWGLGMPLIPIGLVLSRTNSWIYEHILACLPLWYFSSHSAAIGTWPPSPAMTMATLVCVRRGYNQLYSRYFTPLEQKWLKEIKPRASEGGEGGENNRAEEEHHHEMQLGFELQIEVEEEIIDDEQQHQDQQQPQEQQQQREQQHEQLPADAVAQLEEILGQVGDGVPQPAAQVAPAPQDRADVREIDVIKYLENATGALLLPMISFGMGSILKLCLPHTWITPPIRGLDKYPAGILQSRFGRTVVGGCLFVALKDALLLYAKYSLAMSHKQRKVANYDEVPERWRRKSRD